MRSQLDDVSEETRSPPPLIAKPPATVEVAPVPVIARADVWSPEEKVEVPVPSTFNSAVVVALPYMVRPPEVVPLPMVVEARIRLAPVKRLLPENVLLLARSVEEAAVMVMAPPMLKVVPLIEPSVPVR